MNLTRVTRIFSNYLNICSKLSIVYVEIRAKDDPVIGKKYEFQKFKFALLKFMNLTLK